VTGHLHVRWWLIWIVPVGLWTACGPTHVGYKAYVVPHYHVYDFLTKFDGEQQGYGMYTYVLFGRNVGTEAPALPRDVATRYQALLDAIESFTATRDAAKQADIPKQTINLFYIPVKDTARRPTLDSYNSTLATVYLSVARGGIAADRRFAPKIDTGAGPFLISSLRPLNQVRTPAPMLFADLSATNPAAMGEVVAAYKQRLSQ